MRSATLGLVIVVACGGPPLRRIDSSLCGSTKSIDCIQKRENGTCFFVPSPPTCAVEHPDCWKHIEFPDVECP